MEVRTVVSHPEEYAYDNKAVTEDVVDETSLRNGRQAPSYPEKSKVQNAASPKDSFKVVTRKPVNLDEV